MLIKEIELFQGLSTVDQARLLGKMEKLSLPAETTVFEYGDKGDCMYIIASGKIELFAVSPEGRKHTLTSLKDGDIFGEMALVTGNPRSASAVTADQTELFRMDIGTFNELMQAQNYVSIYLFRLLSHRLIKTNHNLTESKSSKENYIYTEILKLPEDLQKIILFTAAVPTLPLDCLPQHFQVNSFVEQVSEHPIIIEDVICFTDDHHLKIRPEAKHIVLELLANLSHESEKQALISGIAKMYEDRRMFDHALQFYAGDGDWEQAFRIIRTYAGEFSARKELLILISEYLQPCPNEVLFQDFAVFMLFLKSCLENRLEVGFSKLESALENYDKYFLKKQVRELYENAAEFSKRLGYTQKALEYLTVGLNLASSDSDKQKGNKERDYYLSKQKLEQANQIALAEKRFFFEKHKLIMAAAFVCAIAIAVFFKVAPPFAGLSREGMEFLGIMLIALLFWAFHIFPKYVVALLMAMMWAIDGLVPPEVALSGFANPDWLFMVCILAVGAAISKTGLIYRFSLLVLKIFPKTYRGQLFGLAVSGGLLNPLIPSGTAKVTLAGPIAQSISEAMGYKDKSKGSAGMALMMMIGYGYLSAFFLTGSNSNILALGLVKGYSVSWIQWAVYAFPVMLLFITVMYFFISAAFKPERSTIQMSSEVLEEQFKLLGKLGRDEKITVAVVGFSMLMLLTQTLHEISTAWIMIIAFSILVVSNVLDSNTIKGIDWTFLLFIAVTFSFGHVSEVLGVEEWLKELGAHWMHPFMDSPYLFLPVLALSTYLISFIIHGEPVIIIMTLCMVPLGDQIGIKPWVILFTILLSREPYVFPYQSNMYLMAYYGSHERAFTHKQAQKLAIWHAFVVIALVTLCIPYWKYVGLILSGL